MLCGILVYTIRHVVKSTAYQFLEGCNCIHNVPKKFKNVVKVKIKD